MGLTNVAELELNGNVDRVIPYSGEYIDSIIYGIIFTMIIYIYGRIYGPY
jgi:hypothetical protein